MSEWVIQTYWMLGNRGLMVGESLSAGGFITFEYIWWIHAWWIFWYLFCSGVHGVARWIMVGSRMSNLRMGGTLAGWHKATATRDRWKFQPSKWWFWLWGPQSMGKNTHQKSVFWWQNGGYNYSPGFTLVFLERDSRLASSWRANPHQKPGGFHTTQGSQGWFSHIHKHMMISQISQLSIPGIPGCRPLVNIAIAIDFHICSPCSMGKSSINGLFPIAMIVSQVVNGIRSSFFWDQWKPQLWNMF